MDDDGDSEPIRTGSEIGSAGSGPTGRRNDSHPWGRRSELGFFSALLQTIVEVVSQPTVLFRKVDPDSPFGSDLLYGVILSVLGSIPIPIWQFFYGIAMGSAMTPGDWMMSAGGLLLYLFAFLVFSPVVAVLAILITTVLVHMVLLLFGWTNRSFGTTAKAISYASTSQLANVIPFCGGLVALGAYFVFAIVGVRELHDITSGQAAVGVLAPLVVFFLCGCLIVLVAMTLSVGIQMSAMSGALLLPF